MSKTSTTTNYTDMGLARSPAGLAVTLPNKVLALLTTPLAFSRTMFMVLAVAFLRIRLILCATRCRSLSGTVSCGSHFQNCRPYTNVAQLSIWRMTHTQVTKAMEKTTTRMMKGALNLNCSIAMKMIATTNEIALSIRRWSQKRLLCIFEKWDIPPHEHSIRKTKHQSELEQALLIVPPPVKIPCLINLLRIPVLNDKQTRNAGHTASDAPFSSRPRSRFVKRSPRMTLHSDITMEIRLATTPRVISPGVSRIPGIAR